MKIQGREFTVEGGNLSSSTVDGDISTITVHLKWPDEETGALAMHLELSEEDVLRIHNRLVEGKAIHRLTKS